MVSLFIVVLAISFTIVVCSSHSVLLLEKPRRLQQQQFISLGGSATCPLSDTIFQFRYNGTSELYEYCNPNTTICSPVLANNTFGRFLSTPRAMPIADGTISAFRACACTRGIYTGATQFCAADFDACTVQPFKNSSLRCFHFHASTDVLKFIWLISVFLLLGLAVCFSCSKQGIKARKYIRMQVCGRMFGSWTTDDYLRADLDEFLRNKPMRAAYLYQTAVARARREAFAPPASRRTGWFAAISLWRTSPNRRNSAAARMDYDPFLDGECRVLTLKTRTISTMEANKLNEKLKENVDLDKSGSSLSWLPDMFSSKVRGSSSGDADKTGTSASWVPDVFRRPSLAESVTLEEMDEEMNSGGRCAICLARLLVGDVVGDIPCGHLFHKACLKDWLTRQNHCPMCRHPEIAELSQRHPLEHPKAKREQSSGEVEDSYSSES